MEAARRQKIENALCKIITLCARAFMRTFAIVCAIMCAFCLLYMFKDSVCVLGAVGSGGCAWVAWHVANELKE